ncbi:MAG: hypothetical protein J6R47_00445 [Acholeplasmatales bacterium]|nr:hypothetical protein [Acholeplasmatales bacterium]
MKPKKKLLGVFIFLGIAIISVIAALAYDISYIERTVNNKIDQTTHDAYMIMIVMSYVAFLLFSAAHAYSTFMLFYKMPYNKNAVITQIFSGMFYLCGIILAVVSFFFTPKETALLLTITEGAFVLSAVVTCYVCKEADLI